MNCTYSKWIQLALDLTTGVSHQDRFAHLLSTIRHVLNCDASALLCLKDQYFVPLAINGLYDDVLGRQFKISEHPRLEAIARAGDIVRFPSDSDLPDPYDGLIANHEDKLHVHSCIGLPLIFDDRLIGAVTIDAFDPQQFVDFTNANLRIISALAASSLNTALLMEKLEKMAIYSSTEQTYEPPKTKIANMTMIGESSPMQDLKQQIEAVANTDLTVLIMGETGVGKELVANALHSDSHRRHENLVYLNCAALPESVAESELFGHVKGAFTGAISHRKGKFELADGGTLFLDEIGELSLSLQAKLLRALQYGDIQRVGDDSVIKVNTRIVAATNRDLSAEIKQGRFRADLYHRLGVFPIFVPPLRERENDIILLAGFFVERCQSKLNIPSITISKQALNKIKSYSWPGNVRELEHAIHRAAVLAKSKSRGGITTLMPEHFALEDNDKEQKVQKSAEPVVVSIESHQGISMKEIMNEFQRKLLYQAYEDNNQNWAAVAKQLQIDPANLHRLIKRLN
ncbi:nitric oxide reductase transcriptional regulator NorR [Methylophaga sp. OBS4]|uniref:nitric oxide reductase transcriptional regulator NorR n=1 Tax=Methylophaga sp. OBS4 TaxID=2991935 RepID=UPI00224EBEE9|nr:nitric oxide reductase transcriptional regulator NorR [Methylophaga sp. OBS4]MCX4186872.1 nitric oxide reductase transcriptional regulator NorR [Methylophaga sp. OBS4]